MSALQVATLGAIAGFTIFLGLPVGRLRNPSLAMKAFLNATATGVLLFLLGCAGARRRTGRDRADGRDAGWNRQLDALRRPGCRRHSLVDPGTDEPRLLRTVDGRREGRRGRGRRTGLAPQTSPS